jgi:hypothetical protein
MNCSLPWINSNVTKLRPICNSKEDIDKFVQITSEMPRETTEKDLEKFGCLKSNCYIKVWSVAKSTDMPFGQGKAAITYSFSPGVKVST